ncbi:MAG: hypothetical protein QOJ64_3763 [Acidobacteriota bacterium]|jgi:hypothetical protein|nr:hypothetical protein [Acidobacteriota bacterium]
MRIKLALLTTAVFVALLGSASSAWAQTGANNAAHPVRVRYDVPKDAPLVAYQKFLQGRKVLEEMADGLNELLRLPQDLTLTATQCGTVNAFYQPRLKAVQLCYEYVRSFNNLHINDQRRPDGTYDNAAVTKALLGTIKFTMIHEIGHALVDILDLPITGGEEDAVDQLAAVVLLSSEDEADTVAVIDAAYTKLLRANANAATQENLTPAQRKWFEDNPPYADEHSLDEQRFYNTVCLAYGSNAQLFADFVTEGVLPKARAARCPFEWKRISRSWTRLLAPFMIK